MRSTTANCEIIDLPDKQITHVDLTKYKVPETGDDWRVGNIALIYSDGQEALIGPDSSSWERTRKSVTFKLVDFEVATSGDTVVSVQLVEQVCASSPEASLL